jgi:hypothetical protein
MQEQNANIGQLFFLEIRKNGRTRIGYAWFSPARAQEVSIYQSLARLINQINALSTGAIVSRFVPAPRPDYG